MLFEHFIVQQIIAIIKATKSEARISSYRTSAGAEVDLILEFNDETIAIEIKASEYVGESDLRGLKSFSEIQKNRSIVAYFGSEVRQIAEVNIWPYSKVLKYLLDLASRN